MAIIAAPAMADKTTAAMPPAKLLKSRRVESAPANGVVETVEEFPDADVVGLVCEGVTMFEVGPVGELDGVVTTTEVALLVLLVFEELPVVDGESDVPTLALVAPMEKSGEVVKTSVILPGLTNSNV